MPRSLDSGPKRSRSSTASHPWLAGAILPARIYSLTLNCLTPIKFQGIQSLPMVSKHCLYIDAIVETFMLNFYLELHFTLVCNLNSELYLELQVFCESSFTQCLYRHMWGFPAGGAYTSYLEKMFWSICWLEGPEGGAAFHPPHHRRVSGAWHSGISTIRGGSRI